MSVALSNGARLIMRAYMTGKYAVQVNGGNTLQVIHDNVARQLALHGVVHTISAVDSLENLIFRDNWSLVIDWTAGEACTTDDVGAWVLAGANWHMHQVSAASTTDYASRSNDWLIGYPGLNALATWGGIDCVIDEDTIHAVDAASTAPVPAPLLSPQPLATTVAPLAEVHSTDPQRDGGTVFSRAFDNLSFGTKALIIGGAAVFGLAMLAFIVYSVRKNMPGVS